MLTYHRIVRTQINELGLNMRTLIIKLFFLSAVQQCDLVYNETLTIYIVNYLIPTMPSFQLLMVALYRLNSTI